MRKLIGAIGMLVLLPLPARAQAVTAEIDCPDGGVAGIGFGRALALEGDTLIVGNQDGNNNAGKVYAFERRAGTWIHVQTIASPAPLAGGRFGASLALRGDLLIVGSRGGEGAVHAYERAGGAWQLDEEIEPSNGYGWGSEFGSTVVLDEEGDDLLVAEPVSQSPAYGGRFYHFAREGGAWVERYAVDPGFDHHPTVSFRAWAMLLEWPRLFVGNQKESAADPIYGSAGAVFVFEFSATAGWVKTQELRLPNYDDINARLGASLDLHGDELAVGAPFHLGNGTRCGAAVVFREQPGGVWTHDASSDVIAPADGQNVEGFGSSVRFTPRHLAIGSEAGGIGGDGGALYLYERAAGEWRLSSKVAPPPVAGYGFAHALALSGDELAVGDPDLHNGVPGTVWILDHSVGGIERTCATSPNSAGAGALMSSLGYASVTQNELWLAVNGAAPNQHGKFYYGPAAQSLPFGNGVACVASGGVGLFRLLPPVPASPDGALTRRLDFTAPPASSGPGALLPGATWYFQFWYRDPAAGGAFFNLSDALRITLCP